MRPAALPYEKLKRVRVILLDVDGILTNGRIYIGQAPRGELFEFKAFHAFDGQGLIFAKDLGYEVGLVTSRESYIVAQRALELGIPNVFQNVKEKLPCVKKFLAERKYSFDQLLYMGDDLLDLPVLLKAGFSATVPGAPLNIRSEVDYVTDLAGGDGAVREVLEMLFKVQGKWPALLRKFTKNFK